MKKQHTAPEVIKPRSKKTLSIAPAWSVESFVEEFAAADELTKVWTPCWNV